MAHHFHEKLRRAVASTGGLSLPNEKEHGIQWPGGVSDLLGKLREPAASTCNLSLSKKEYIIQWLGITGDSSV